MNSKSVGNALQLRPAGSLLRALRTFRSIEIHYIDKTAHYFSLYSSLSISSSHIPVGIKERLYTEPYLSDLQVQV